MRLTTKSRYGTRAIFDLSYNYAGKPVHVKDISKRQEIPLKYLEQIFWQLKEAKIVRSVRGPTGGYMLAKDSSKITVWDIIKAVREPIDVVYCVDDVKKCNRAKQCVTRSVWKEAAGIIKKTFNSITVNDLCKKGKEIGIKKDVKHSFDYNV
jgi:Rrf2 family protein